MTLVKADLGTKRVCPSCNARFYDLQKRPIECPKCAVSFEPESLYKQRRPRPPEPEKAVQRPSPNEVKGREEVETAEAEEGLADEAAEVEPADEEEEEAVGVEEEEEEPESAGMSVVDPAAGGAEMEDIEEAEAAEEDVEDPALLEEVGEEDEDVSGIIDADLEKDER
ncbi:MAG TPA: TIGR02300 family protein [Rhizomicrobium sp.]|jgi:uncharacterized protein (TIGR02300 family)